MLPVDLQHFYINCDCINMEHNTVFLQLQYFSILYIANKASAVQQM